MVVVAFSLWYYCGKRNEKFGGGVLMLALLLIALSRQRNEWIMNNGCGGISALVLLRQKDVGRQAEWQREFVMAFFCGCCYRWQGRPWPRCFCTMLRCYGGLSQENYDGHALSGTVDLVLVRVKDYYDGLGLVCGVVSRVVLLHQIRLQLNLFCVCFMILNRFEYSLFYYIPHYLKI